MEKTQINTSSWHARFYRIGVAMWSKWVDRGTWCYDNPNTCLYLRVICLWLPFMLILNIGIYTSPIWVTVLVSSWFGLDATVISWLTILKWVAIVALFIGAIVFCYTVYGNYRYKKRVNETLGEQYNSDKKELKQKSFIYIVAQYIQDRHDMICRSLELVDTKTNQNKESK